jgi:hypothetical protein
MLGFIGSFFGGSSKYDPKVALPMTMKSFEAITKDFYLNGEKLSGEQLVEMVYSVDKIERNDTYYSVTFTDTTYVASPTTRGVPEFIKQGNVYVIRDTIQVLQQTQLCFLKSETGGLTLLEANASPEKRAELLNAHIAKCGDISAPKPEGYIDIKDLTPEQQEKLNNLSPEKGEVLMTASMNGGLTQEILKYLLDE